MKLITKAIEAKVPATLAQNGKGDAAIIYAKFFHPRSNLTWYMTEYDPVGRIAWGLVQGFEEEWGYFSIDEMETISSPGVERDLYFGDGHTIGEVRRRTTSYMEGETMRWKVRR